MWDVFSEFGVVEVYIYIYNNFLGCKSIEFLI